MADPARRATPVDNTTPLVSVIMATYNGGRYIRAALESVLQQAYSFFEIIVVDDGSTDDTPMVIRTLIDETGAQIRYLQQQNRGAPAAQNVGLRLARGQVITFLDSDDLWPAHRLPAQLALFAQGVQPGAGAIGIVLGRKERFADGVVVDPAELAAANQRPVHYSLGSSLFARWVFAVVGQFDETIGYTADWDWFARALMAGIPMASDPRITLLGRIHARNATQDRALGAHLTVQMVRRHLDRQRSASAVPDLQTT